MTSQNRREGKGVGIGSGTATDTVIDIIEIGIGIIATVTEIIPIMMTHPVTGRLAIEGRGTEIVTATTFIIPEGAETVLATRGANLLPVMNLRKPNIRL